ncbi:MAG: DEAD/DEAH box helicase [Lentisphaeraceae bacterium]|nr:DEAD/DEAH box helicase [Lentisphaeraceae bacterium]
MSFSSLDLPEYILKAVEALSYNEPTPIQEQAIPLIIAGKDVVAEAQTGTGKTAAFALPVIKKLNELPDKKKKISVLSLVLVPTRELAVQVAASFKSYSQFSPKKIKMISLIGGENIQDQIRGLRMGVDVVVATPGRLLDIIKRSEIRLVELEHLIIDEADKMLDLGFSEELAALLEKLPKTRQNLLFSATFPPKVVTLSEKFIENPEKIIVDSGLTAVEAIAQRVIQVNKENRRPLLQKLLKEEPWDQTMVFVVSKRSARNLAEKLKKEGIKAVGFHGDLDQSERLSVLKQFKKKEYQVLIATDIAARGIDIEKLSCVINYDLPRSPRDYTHRIGRTGRAGESGIAVSFVDHDTEAHFRIIEKRYGKRLDREQIEGFELTGEASVSEKGSAPVKGKRKSKKDKLREEAARQNSEADDKKDSKDSES